jgi:hypothetical protein
MKNDEKQMMMQIPMAIDELPVMKFPKTKKKVNRNIELSFLFYAIRSL